MRDCVTQSDPNGTLALWYAGTATPFPMLEPAQAHEAAVPTVQVEAVYEPESVPLEQVRVCEAQVCPKETEAARYAGTDEPCAIVAPLSEHEAAPPTVQVEAVYEPESVPLPHTRVCEAQVCPKGTLAAS